MSQISFYRTLLWLPVVVSAPLALLWLVPGVSLSPLIGLPVYILAVGALYAALPYAALALWTDRWLRSTPAPVAIWRRAVRLPLQLVPAFVAWHTVLDVVNEGIVWENFIATGIVGILWVLVLGYAYVGLAYVLTRCATWAGYVRSRTRASTT